MSTWNPIYKHRLRLGLLVALLATLTAGLFAVVGAQSALPTQCRTFGDVRVCGDVVDEGANGIAVIQGNMLTLGYRNEPPVVKVLPISDPEGPGGSLEQELRKPTFIHNPTSSVSAGHSDTLTGDVFLINDPTNKPMTQSRLKTGVAGILHVRTDLGQIQNPSSVPPIEADNGFIRNENLKLEFLRRAQLLRLFVLAPKEERAAINVTFDLKSGDLLAGMLVRSDSVFNAKQNTFPNQDIRINIRIDKNGVAQSPTIESIRMNAGGLSGTVKGIKVSLSNGNERASLATNAITQQQEEAKGADFEADAIEFSRADNPSLPNFDPTNPDLLFRINGVQYKDGRFSVKGGAVGIPDWQVGSALKLTKQQISIVEDDKAKSTTLVISSTMTFPTGSIATDTRAFLVSLRVVGKEQANGTATAAISGTLLTSARPALNFGPLSITTPAKTDLVFDQTQNFFGLKAEQVTLRWGPELGSGTGVQTGFKLGVDKDKKLVVGLGAGGGIKLPDIRNKALTMQLNANVTSTADLVTFTINGTARLALPSNGNVAPTVAMFIRSGKNVRDTCTPALAGCLKKFEYKLSSFELSVGGFGFGLTNAQGTNDGGFGVDKASLKVPVGIKSVAASVSGFKVTGNGDVTVAGGSMELPPIQVGNFSLVGVKGSFIKNATGYEFRGAGTVPLPGLDPSGGPRGKKISGEVVIRTLANGSFQGFGVTIEFNTGSPGIPIGTTGMELVSMRGSFDVNANTVKIAVGMRASSVLKIATFPAATVDGNAEVQFNPFKLTANAKLAVMVFDVAQASMGIGHQQGFANAPGFNVNFSVDMTLVQGSASLRIGEVTLSNGQKKIGVAASALFKVGIKKNQIVKFIPPVDVNFASVQFDGGHFQVKGADETLGLMGKVKVNMPLFIPDVKLSIFVDMRGPNVDVTDTDKYTLIGATEVRARAARGVAGFSTRTLSAGETQGLRLNVAGKASIQQETIPVVIDQPGMALFGISYPQGAPSLRLQLPDGSILTEQTIDQLNSGFLRHTGTVTEEHQLAFILNNAQPGTYTMIVDDAPTVYDKVSYMFNAEPTVSNVLVSCGGAPVEGVNVTCGGEPRGPLVGVNWTAQDTDTPTATVRIGYIPVPAEGSTADMSALTTLAEGLPLGDGNFTWDLHEVPTGRYQIVVSAEDSRHAASHTIAETVIAVEDKRAPAAPQGLSSDPLPGELLVTWTPNGERDLAGYEIGFGIVQPGIGDSPDAFIYSRDMGAKQVVITASNVLDARLWGLTDNEEVFVGIRAYDLSGNYSAWSPLLRAKPWALAPEAWTPAPGGTLPMTGRVEVAFASPLNLSLDAPLPTDLLTVRRADGSLVAGRTEPITNVEGDKIVGLSFVPEAALRGGATYTVLVTGGAAGVTAEDGRQMAQDYTWTFVAEQQSINLPLVIR